MKLKELILKSEQINRMAKLLEKVATENHKMAVILTLKEQKDFESVHSALVEDFIALMEFYSKKYMIKIKNKTMEKQYTFTNKELAQAFIDWEKEANENPEDFETNESFQKYSISTRAEIQAEFLIDLLQKHKQIDKK